MYKDFTEMPVWQSAMNIAESIFHLTTRLPKQEDYGLTSQLRRAAVSISANIAEGFGRQGAADKRKFYDYARGSAFETKSLLLYGERVKYFATEKTDTLIQQINEVIHEINKIKISLGRECSFFCVKTIFDKRSALKIKRCVAASLRENTLA